MQSVVNQAHKTYPFTAIVGQEEMKLALLLNVVDPLIGGVLIMGHRGTGKSTAVRALADLLPEIDVVLVVLITAIQKTICVSSVVAQRALRKKCRCRWSSFL